MRTSNKGPANPVQEDAPKRQLFHTTGGAVDVSRLVEQAIPAVIVGAFVILANSKVTESQVGDLRADLREAQQVASEQQKQIASQSEKLAGITAQIATFLGQQVQINSTMESRITYIERERQTPQFVQRR